MKYVNLKASEALDAFVQKQCSSLARRVGSHPNKYKISLSVKANARNPDGIVISYEVIGIVKVARQSHLSVKKKGKDVKKTISDVIDALSKQLRRKTEKKERSRRTLGQTLKPVRHYTWELTAD